MALEDIKKELEQRFEQPLPEFYKRRIIFWNDEAKEFINEISELSLSNAKVLILRENNQFVSKKLLSNDDLDSNYLVYNPLTSDIEEDWFLDIKLYSEEYRSDITSRYMQEMNILNTPALRKVVKEYTTFFNAASRRNALMNIDIDIDTPNKLHLAVLCAICGLRKIDVQDIIQTVLTAGDDINNTIKLDLLKYGASDVFWQLVNQKTGYTGTNIDELNVHIILSAVSKSCNSKLIEGLDDYYNDVQNSFCYDFITEWVHSGKKDLLFEIARYTEVKLSLYNRFERFEIDDLLDIECLPCVDEIIISKMMKSAIDHSIDAKGFISIIEKRRTCAWYERFECYYDGLLQVCNMQLFYEEHRCGFHLVEAKKIWNAYTYDYYLMDTYYRYFHNAFSKSFMMANPKLDDDFKLVAETVEKEYKNWFLNDLAENWTNIVQKDLTEIGYVKGIEKQEDFYLNHVKNVEGKVYVIISDALRYEVASSLVKDLALDRSKVELSSMQGVFPTITKFGMAALLPKNKLSVEVKNGSVKVLADGHTTEMSDRDEVLKLSHPNSVALRYKDFITMKREEKRYAVKGKDIVYIYHDTIDSASHNDDTSVFTACDTTIEEIKNLINIITLTLSGINIVVTSDHGFLYTYEPLREDDKMDRTSFIKDIIEQGRRYVLTDEKADPDFLINVKSFMNDNGVLSFAPRENIRIKGAGGQNFVHGGISLQEMVVPVITYRYLRSGYKSYIQNKDKIDTKSVTLSLLSSSRKISNKIFNLRFYQKEAVANNYVPCTYDVFITDAAGQAVSDKQKVIADRTSDNNKDREFKCTFNLKPIKFSSRDLYYLVIQDEKGLQIPTKEEFQIDIPMAFDEFDF